MPVKAGGEEVLPPQVAPTTGQEDPTGATPFGPGESSQAPPQSTEPQPAPDVSTQVGPEDPVAQDVPEPIDPTLIQSFMDLLSVGKLQRTKVWLGHHFVMRTLLTGELLDVGVLHAPYAATVASEKAYQAAILAASMVMVDNKPLVVPLSDDTTDMAAKFEHIKAHWFPPVLDALYTFYLEMEDEVARVIEAMGKASG